jgi:hypothetical protein
LFATVGYYKGALTRYLSFGFKKTVRTPSPFRHFALQESVPEV